MIESQSADLISYELLFFTVLTKGRFFLSVIYVLQCSICRIISA